MQRNNIETYNVFTLKSYFSKRKKIGQNIFQLIKFIRLIILFTKIISRERLFYIWKSFSFIQAHRKKLKYLYIWIFEISSYILKNKKIYYYIFKEN